MEYLNFKKLMNKHLKDMHSKKKKKKKKTIKSKDMQSITYFLQSRTNSYKQRIN
jgi:hypothetical protein